MNIETIQKNLQAVQKQIEVETGFIQEAQKALDSLKAQREQYIGMVKLLNALKQQNEASTPTPPPAPESLPEPEEVVETPDHEMEPVNG